MKGRHNIKPNPAILWLCVFLILSGATLLRVSYNANTIIAEPIRADAAYYLIYANNLLEHGTFSKDRTVPPVPDAYWPPGFPVFLAFITKASQLLEISTYNAILNSQLLLGVATVFLCFLIGRSFLPGYWSLLPPLLTAYSPHLVSMASYILVETLFGFTLLISLYALIKALDTRRTFYWLLSGSGFAAGYLVNPVSLFIAPLLALAITYYPGVTKGGGLRGRGGARAVALLIAPLIVTASLWATRTAISVPADQPTAASRLLANLTVGLYPDYHEKWRASILQPDEAIVVPGAGVNHSYSSYFQELSEKFASEPLQMLTWFLVQKPLALWGWDIQTGWGGIYIYRIEVSLYETSIPAIATYSAMYAAHLWLLSGAVLGLGFLFIGSDRQLVPMLLYILALYVSAVYVVTQSEARYSIPLRAELYLCATFFLWRAQQWISRIRQASLAAATD